MKNLIVSSVLAILVALLWYYKPFEERNQLIKHEEEKAEDLPKIPVQKTFHLPPNRDGVIFITSGSSGIAHEAILELTKHGYYVLVGVASNLDRKAFTYVQRKGLELIKFDMMDPTMYPDLVYRLRHIRRDLDRPLSGIIINLSDYMEKSMNSAWKVFEINDVDINYKAVVKSPIKFTQALLELCRIQQKEMNKDKANIPLLSDTTNSTATAATEMSGWNAGGLRLQLLHADCTNQPSLPCLFQDTVLHYFTMIQELQWASNYSISFIPTIEHSVVSSSATIPSSEENTPYAHIPWVLEDGSDVASQDTPKDTLRLKAIMHAMISKYPLAKYNT